LAWRWRPIQNNSDVLLPSSLCDQSLQQGTALISIVLYGRNDSYGYNLAKRAALGLNCMAEALTDPDDEILFVDYNTPDELPTFPESIADTLTHKARQLLRIFRVHPAHHAPVASQTHLPVLEPIARNVAIRRSNPANRWVLSTNTEMIFVPRQGDSLSEIVADLSRGFYAIPRFEIPESLWETFDRYDPRGTLAQVERWGWDAFLNDVTFSQYDAILYDAPGDFQLVERSDLFAIDGFDESMLLGWHVDMNLFRRLSLLYGGAETSDLAGKVFGYHCSHLRQASLPHTPGIRRNDGVKAYHVKRANLPKHRRTWGLVNAELEEISLRRPESPTTKGAVASVSGCPRAPAST
jgi:hypothetical protein